MATSFFRTPFRYGPFRCGPWLVPLLMAVATASAQTPPLPVVGVAVVVKQNIAPSHNFIGRVDPIQMVQVHALVQGVLQEVAFKEGSDVKAGQLLFVIDPDMYDAQVKNAEAAVAKAQATLKNDQQNVQRDQTLAARGEAPQATLDQALATRDGDAAGLQAAQAQLLVAQINLGYTKISSPIAGRIGAAAVTKGNLVNASTAVLATVVQLDPIRVVFSVDDRSLVSAEQTSGSSVAQLTTQFLPRIRLGNDAMYDQTGKLSFVSNQVDTTSGTIPIYAEFPNPKALLVPGQFVTVVVQPAAPEERLLVPVTAAQQDAQGKFVLVVGADNKVTQQRFSATEQNGQDWVVENGLKEGQKVIVSGVQKVRPGQVVNPQIDNADGGGSQGPSAAAQDGAATQPSGR